MISEQRFRVKKNGEPYFNCYCRNPELIENYEKAVADPTQTWDVHHQKEELYSYKELKERNEYFDVPPEELIFLTKEEHRKIDSMCKRVREAMKGKHHSEETKKKISAAMKNKPTWNKGKHLSEYERKRLHWFNDGTKNIRAETCPDGFVPGRLK